MALRAVPTRGNSTARQRQAPPGKDPARTRQGLDPTPQAGVAGSNPAGGTSSEGCHYQFEDPEFDYASWPMKHAARGRSWPTGPRGGSAGTTAGGACSGRVTAGSRRPARRCTTAWSAVTSPRWPEPPVARRHHRTRHRRGEVIELYLCAIRDVFSKRIAGYSIDALARPTDPRRIRDRHDQTGPPGHMIEPVTQTAADPTTCPVTVLAARKEEGLNDPGFVLVPVDPDFSYGYEVALVYFRRQLSCQTWVFQ